MLTSQLLNLQTWNQAAFRRTWSCSADADGWLHRPRCRPSWLKSRQPDVLTSTFLVTKSELSLLNIFLKLTKQLVRFLKNAALCKSINNWKWHQDRKRVKPRRDRRLTSDWFQIYRWKFMNLKTQHKPTPYMLGFEESRGYLIKPFVRDKDAIRRSYRSWNCCLLPFTWYDS